MSKEKTPQGYLFLTTGEIKLVDLARTITQLLAEWEPLTYLRHIEGDLFFLSHGDNDLPSLYLKSSQPKNQALAYYFADSPFLGAVLLLEIDDEDNIVAREWPPVAEVLARYEMSHRKGRKPPDVDIHRVRRARKEKEVSSEEEGTAADPASDSSYSDSEGSDE